jgi:hypothetical protein
MLYMSVMCSVTRKVLNLTKISAFMYLTCAASI